MERLNRPRFLTHLSGSFNVDHSVHENLVVYDVLKVNSIFATAEIVR